MQYCLHSGKLTKFPVQNMHRLQGLSQLKLLKALWNTARHFLQTVDVHSTSLWGKLKDSGLYILSIWGTFSKCSRLRFLAWYIIAVHEFSIDNYFLKTIYIYISRFEVNNLCRHSKIFLCLPCCLTGNARYGKNEEKNGLQDKRDCLSLVLTCSLVHKVKSKYWKRAFKA